MEQVQPVLQNNLEASSVFRDGKVLCAGISSALNMRLVHRDERMGENVRENTGLEAGRKKQRRWAKVRF